MKLEIKDRDGRTVMQTKHKECMYDSKVRSQMIKSGYKLYLDGKLLKKGELK